MVVLMEKDLVLPPPPYLASEHRMSTQSLASSVFSQASGTSTPQRQRRYRPFSRLPSHLVLHIVYKMLPDATSRDSLGCRYTEEELSRRTTKTLHWMASSLRFVNRTFYIAAMHILRSTYLVKYLSLVRKPYTSDPFPLSSQPAKAKGESFLATMQRESHVLDLFLLFQLRQDVFSDESSLHLDREDSLRDLFSFMQPRARLEDLIRDFGCNTGLIYTPNTNLELSTSTPYSRQPRPERLSSTLKHGGSNASLHAEVTPLLLHPNALSFEHLSISFSLRRIGIVLSSEGGRKRTIVEIPRDRSETLERCASHLIYELKAWVDRTDRR